MDDGINADGPAYLIWFKFVHAHPPSVERFSINRQARRIALDDATLNICIRIHGDLRAACVNGFPRWQLHRAVPVRAQGDAGLFFRAGNALPCGKRRQPSGAAAITARNAPM